MPRIPYQGREVEAEEVDVLTTGEHWNSYQLSDGSVLRVKIVVVQVFRVLNEYDPSGAPIYVVRSQNVVSVRPLDDLKP